MGHDSLLMQNEKEEGEGKRKIPSQSPSNCYLNHSQPWFIAKYDILWPGVSLIKSAASDGSPPASCPSPTYSPGQQRETKTLTLCKHCSATAQTLVLINTVLVTSALKKKLTPTQPDPAQQSSVNTQKWSCTSGKINYYCTGKEQKT